ncbi:outer membrane protein ImpK/VasF, OmpA/MotB domain (plasmid) [Sinorhizobium americanum CCGM7]|uniref:type VI secretion system protein TssL, long form n=1 Tax=Sinorhizobium americanum TaxID=194963 RepID=UPI0004D956F4|nr:type VI secretion system protein TssL, long form [Sinorhizobium americanum]APG87624.1 outer membrane protein ImpK/VasF, OmpA/MotB domain [Sinorhizobium americanum CCGM7]
MTKERSSSWQDLPTVVEITEAGTRKARSARKMAEMLDDIVEFDSAGDIAGPPSPRGSPVASLVEAFDFGGDGIPTLVKSGAPLINLAHALRHADVPPDIDELRRAAIGAINRYERDLAAARISPERARAAHYIVCATVDDVILSKPWGVRAGWARSGLVSTFHMDVTGGDRVFDLLDHFHQSPGTNKDLLLLIYLCLSLAFEGRTRVSDRGTLELGRIRDSLYKTLLGQYGVFERELSPHWQGVQARHKPLRTSVAMWTLLAALVLALALGYILVTFSLNGRSDATFERLANLPPHDTPSLTIQAPPAKVEAPRVVAAPPKPPEPEPPEPPPAPPRSRLDNLLAFLQPEVDRKLVTLSDADGRLLVRINNSGLFDVGSAEVSGEFRGLLERIGGALAAERFRAIVIGYTDNVPIRTVQFPSNWHLSEARAKAVGDILAAYTGTDAIITDGRADSDPIAGNDTPEGREMNRRTEILVLTDPGERLDAARIPSTHATNAPAQENGTLPENRTP